MPPTDPAAKQHKWNLEVAEERAETVGETQDHSTVRPGSGSGSKAEEGSGRGSCSGGGDLNSNTCGSSSSTSMPPPSLLPKRKLSGGHQAVEGPQPGSGSSAGSTTASTSASSASSVASPQEGTSIDDCDLLGEEDALTEASGSSFLVAAGVLDEDDATDTLAAGEVGALPLPPQRSAPKACDMELDMFGAPEEESAGLVD